ncbi:hypothetical protein ACWKWK_15690 [Pseudoxanthomonas beigongshangi]
MANPWDNDEIVVPARNASPPKMAGGNFWDADEIVDDGPGLEIEIVGGIPESKVGQRTGLTADQVTTANGGRHNPANDSDFARLISGQQAPQPQVQEGNAVGRFLGDIGGREVLQGAYGLYGALGGDALNQYVLSPIDRAAGWGNQLGIGDRTYREAAAEQADEWGMRRPQTAAQRIMADIGEGLTGTGLTLGLGGLLNTGRQAATSAAPTIQSRLGDLLSSNWKTQTAAAAGASGASSATREAGGGATSQFAASLLGGMSPGAATSGTSGLTRLLLRGRDGAGMRSTIDDFARVGTTPKVGQATGNFRTQGLESLLSGFPTSAGVMGRASTRQAEEMGQGLTDWARTLSRNPGSEAAGRAIERGVETFNQNTKAMRQALYWRLDKLMPADTKVTLPNTQRALADLTTPVTGAEATTGAMVNPAIKRMADNLAHDLTTGGGTMPYQAMASLRSRVGQELEGAALYPTDKPIQEYKRLYGALSLDMQAAARAQGADAAKAAARANDYTRASIERLETLRRVVDRNGGPEKVFKAVMEGSSEGATTLRAVMKSLPDDGQKALTAAVIRRMGLATPGVQNAAGDAFSANTFLTNWNRLSPEARRTLFDRYGPGFSDDMDRIARVADNIKSGSEVYRNPAGTANKVGAMSYLGSLALAAGTGQKDAFYALVLAGLGASGSAHLMTSPSFVKWLANSTTVPVSSALPQIQQLHRIAEEEQDPEIADFARRLEQETRYGIR